MRLLNGSDLSYYIKERQARQVRSLRQTHGVSPKLLVLRDSNSPIISKYVELKKTYGEDISVGVDDRVVSGDLEVFKSEIIRANQDSNLHGIIVQLPLQNPGQTDEVISLIDANKDVDNLTEGSDFIAATALAIDWLVTGYNVDLERSRIAIVGRGRLVGRPLRKLWQARKLDITVFGRNDSQDLPSRLPGYNVVITATGVPGLIKSDMIASKTVVVDAGTAEDDSSIVGDFSDDLYDRDDLTITPRVGGVGPLTIAALFDNAIRAAEKTIKK